MEINTVVGMIQDIKRRQAQRRMLNRPREDLLNQCLEIVQIAEAGHGVPYDQSERFSDVVQTFLRSVNA